MKKMNVEMIPVDKIEPNPAQVREKVEENNDLDKLADTIKERGLLHPLILRPKSNGNYQLISGERRWRAIKKTDIDKVPSLVKDVSDEEQMIDSLIENVHREDLSTVEKGEGAYRVFLLNGIDMEPKKLAKQLHSINDYTRGERKSGLDSREEKIKNICKNRINKPLRTVRTWLEAKSVSPKIRKIEIEQEEQTSGTILARLSTIDDEKEQEKVYQKIRKGDMSHVEVSKFVTSYKKLPEEEKEIAVEMDREVDIEDLKEITGLVKEAREKGKEDIAKELLKEDGEIDIETAKIKLRGTSTPDETASEVPGKAEEKLEEQKAEIEQRVEDMKEKEEEAKKSDKVQRRKKLRENWENLNGMVVRSRKVFCPICEKEEEIVEKGNLKFDCKHELTVEEARKIAKKEFEKA